MVLASCPRKFYNEPGVDLNFIDKMKCTKVVNNGFVKSQLAN